MAAQFKVESMSSNDKALWECVPADRYAGIPEIEKACASADIPANIHSLMAKLHHFRKEGWIDGHEKQGHWLFKRNEPRAKRVPALVGVSVPTPKEETREDKLLREIDGVMEAAMELASRTERLKAQLAVGVANEARLAELEAENTKLKRDLEDLDVMKAAFKVAMKD